MRIDIQAVLDLHRAPADQIVVRRAVGLLPPRWNLTEEVAVFALSDAAADLGLEVTDLSAPVVLSPHM